MIQRVYEQVAKVKSLNTIVVATDDQRIATHVDNLGGRAIMTESTHASGTDRCAEIMQYFPNSKIVVNVQGDEPFIDPRQIEELISCFQDRSEEHTSELQSLMRISYAVLCL